MAYPARVVSAAPEATLRLLAQGPAAVLAAGPGIPASLGARRPSSVIRPAPHIGADDATVVPVPSRVETVIARVADVATPTEARVAHIEATGCRHPP